MGRNYQEPYDEYEDELDRMRARRRKASKQLYLDIFLVKNSYMLEYLI